jgi:threonine/homoserine/homoserine lactone efflux protein
MGDFLAFLVIAALVIVTPGQDTALTIRNTVMGGRRGGLFTAVGVSSGQAVWTVATSAGLAALLVASEPAFLALKFAGALYLVYLGGDALLAALRNRAAMLPASPEGRPTMTAAGAFRQGLVSNLGNPKMAVFFTSLLPQFASEQASFATLLPLGLLFCSLTLVWLTAYAVAVAKAGAALLRPRIRRLLEAVMGVTLVALGLRLAAERR